MKDWLFYPFAMLIIGGMIAYALSFATPTGADTATEFKLEGETLSTLFPAEGTSFSIAGDANNPNAYAVLSAHIAKELAPPSAGVFATLGPSWEKKFAGQNIRVTIHARKGRANPVDRFQFAYFTDGAGSSGWQTFDLSSEFQDISFEFTPGLPNGDPSSDYVGIWPDPNGRQRTMDVKWLKVETVEKTVPAP